MNLTFSRLCPKSTYQTPDTVAVEIQGCLSFMEGSGGIDDWKDGGGESWS